MLDLSKVINKSIKYLQNSTDFIFHTILYSNNKKGVHYFKERPFKYFVVEL